MCDIALINVDKKLTFGNLVKKEIKNSVNTEQIIKKVVTKNGILNC